MRMIIMVLAASMGVQAAAAETPFDRAVGAVQARMAAIDEIDNVIPGRAIVAVEAGRAPVIDVRGVTRVEGGVPVAADTPFYIASMTKAFVSLMAIRLDEAGVMPLDRTLADAFPDMKLSGIDPATITMRRLLNHQLGFTAQALNFRTAYTDRVAIEDYPRIVALTQGPADPAFQYSNLGYLLYAAALEQKTGKPWQAWMDELVFQPLAMRHSSGRTSRLDNVAWAHERVGDDWRQLPPKRDEVMHAAGGLFVSAADMARFLTAQTGGASPIPASSIAASRRSDVVTKLDDGPMTCTGYTFGWIRCSAFGEDILTHSGEYAGQRSVMLVVPARRAAFAAMFNSDSMTGGLSQQLAMIFVASLAGKTEGMPDAAAFAERYKQIAERYRQNRTREEQEARARPEWGGWRWAPTQGELGEYRGAYRNPAYGEIRVEAGHDGLDATINGTGLALTPAVRDRFGAALTSYDNLLPVVFERDSGGQVKAVTAGDFRFERQRP